MSKFYPYSCQTISDADIDAVVKVLKSDWLTQGPSIGEFESAIADYVGAKYAVAVNSGTAALHIACLAAGITSDDEVITVSNTFLASANCVRYCGAMPVFVDIDPSTGLMDVAQVESAITDKTKMIIPVDFSGSVCDMDRLNELAKKHDLMILQDASHSLGATYKGKMVGDGSMADMTVFSFHPVKPLTTGEGGMVVTQDETLYKKLLEYRCHGMTKDPSRLHKNDGPWYYEMQELGYNYRMTDIQAALGTSQMAAFPSLLAKRRELADVYDAFFDSVDNITPLKVPEECCSGHHLYVVKIDFDLIGKSRGEVMAALREHGIGSQVHYIPVHTQPYYSALGVPQDSCPNTISYYSTALSIPLFPKMSEDDVRFIGETVLKVIS
jgi:UDP-4-amino-4,6-dideoxy-N-acetyl-beta-L-altrosamine transaminase